MYAMLYLTVDQANDKYNRIEIVSIMDFILIDFWKDKFKFYFNELIYILKFVW